MRIKRLDLARYGKFTDHVLDFGETVVGQPDLHIVFGPNEAGKSTAMAAFLDLLFGIENKSRYNFLHPYPTMRIGASLELGGGVHDLVRIKRLQNSLLDGSDRPIAESVLQGELGGFDRDSYRTMFSLDDETLEAGGESILASKGDLGQLLFSASAGLADLSRTLLDLRVEADGFYKYRARSGELPMLKAELAALKDERERIDTFASEYAQLVATHDRASVLYDEAIAERGLIRSRMDEIQRHLNALPRSAALRSIRERIEPLASLPDAPLGWIEDLPKLQAAEIELATRADGVADEVKQISAELEAIVIDEAALRLAGRIDQLAGLRARHVTAEKDIPDRRLQLREAELAVSGILARLGQAKAADPARLMLGPAIVGALRDLIETRSGVETSVEAARSELSEARHRLDEARANLRDAGGGKSAGRKREQQVAALSAAVAALRGSDHVARRRVAERACTAHRETLAERMAALRPWTGDAEQLANMVVPEPDDLEGWREVITDAQREIESEEEEIERLEADRRQSQSELDKMGDVAGFVSHQDAARIRAGREEAWACHRRRLDTMSAETFEAALRHDDIVTNARLRHEKDVTALRQARHALVVIDAEIDRKREQFRTVLEIRQSADENISALCRAMALPLPENGQLSRLQAWLGRRDKALEARSHLKQAERDLREAEADIGAACTTLSAALDALAVPYDADAGFDALLAAAQSAIDSETELKALRVAVQDRERELKSRERAFEKSSEAERGWHAAWAEACSACWLAEGGKTLSVAAVREMLIALADLGPAIEKQAGLADRIRKMEHDQAAFAEEAIAIARGLGLDPEAGSALDLAHLINDRLLKSRAAEAAKAARSEALDGAQARQRTLAEALTIHEKRKAEMTAFFEVATLAEVGGKLQEIAKRAELQEQAGAAARDILEALRLPSIEEAEAALDDADRAALELELESLTARFEDHDQRSRDLFSARTKAADRLDAVGGDAAAARIEEKRRTTLLDIEEKARRYLRLRLGIVAAEQALRAYRDQHRSSMMARASAAFRTISREAYTSLATQQEKDSEFLIAVAAEGGSKVASDLSKGTRFQLYLALRVAGYYEFAQSRRPVPFIADDIMETFDDFRAEEAFRLFAEMAQVGQVIYLTHHQHLCDMVQRIYPGVRIHNLAAPRSEQGQRTLPFVTTSTAEPVRQAASGRTAHVARRR